MGALSYGFAGAIAGLGKGLVDQAEADRQASAERLRREFQTAEREASQAFSAQQSDMDRAWRSEESEADRAFRAGESEKDRAARLRAASISASRPKGGGGGGNNGFKTPGALLATLVGNAMDPDSPGGSEITAEEESGIQKARELATYFKGADGNLQFLDDEDRTEGAKVDIGLEESADNKADNETSLKITREKIEAEMERLEATISSKEGMNDADNTAAMERTLATLNAAMERLDAAEEGKDDRQEALIAAREAINAANLSSRESEGQKNRDARADEGDKNRETRRDIADANREARSIGKPIKLSDGSMGILIDGKAQAVLDESGEKIPFSSSGVGVTAARGAVFRTILSSIEDSTESFDMTTEEMIEKANALTDQVISSAQESGSASPAPKKSGFGAANPFSYTETPPAEENLPEPKSKAEYDALPPGTIFMDPDGIKRKKPGG